MPVFRSGETPPDWCEVRFFEIVELAPGESRVFERVGAKEKLLIGGGRCQIRHHGRIIAVEEGANLDVGGDDPPIEIIHAETTTTAIRISGAWGETLGGSGLFTVSKADPLRTTGDPTTYSKETNFDSHYHDCDEYWIIYEGAGVAASENRLYTVNSGDCVATGMGHHHDFPRVKRPVKAVYFETTLEGEQRTGHLWDFQHGKAQPKPERV